MARTDPRPHYGVSSALLQARDMRGLAHRAVTEGVNLPYVERMREALYAAADRIESLEGGASPIAEEIAAERVRQDAKWGGIPGVERRDDHTYAAVLGEEFGECCKAWLERNTAALREELIQTAAVAVAWIEELDNGGAMPRA